MRDALSLLLLAVASCRPATTPTPAPAPAPRAEPPPPVYEAPRVTPAPMETAAAPPPPAKLASAAVSCESPPPIPKRVLLGYPVADLGDLSRERPDTGGFDTQGVVLRQFEPAPCPPGATCKPQHPSHIILASEVSDEDRAIFLETPKPKAFAIGTRIRVSVVFCGDRGSSSLAHGQLLAAAPLSS